MAQMNLSLEQFNASVQKMANPIDDFTPVLKRIRGIIVDATRQNFDDESTPDGQKWPPLKRPRRGAKNVRKRKKHPESRDIILQDTGVLKRSVTGRYSGNDEEMTKTSLIYGTNVVYAGTHQ